MQVQHQHNTARKQCRDTAKLLLILVSTTLSVQYGHGAAISKSQNIYNKRLFYDKRKKPFGAEKATVFYKRVYVGT